jgi:hypothetical protein
VHKIPEPQVRGPPETHWPFRPEHPEVTKFLAFCPPSHAYLSSPPPKLSRFHLHSINTTETFSTSLPKRKRNRRRTYSQLVTQIALNTNNNNTQILLKNFNALFSRITSKRYHPTSVDQ